jgi:hypothetical protein
MASHRPEFAGCRAPNLEQHLEALFLRALEELLEALDFGLA